MTGFVHDLIVYMPQILSGLENTLILMGIISMTGFLGGIVVFYLSLNGNETCRKIVDRYISFFIGTPLLVHLFLMYYGLPGLGIHISPLTVSVIGFTLNVSAYNARYLMAAFNGLDQVEIEAARSQGFNRMEIFRSIILPQTLRLGLPALTNQVIQNLKDTSIAFLIQYQDFFSQIQEVAATNFEFFKAYMVAGMVYLALISVIVVAARQLEKKIALPGFQI